MSVCGGSGWKKAAAMAANRRVPSDRIGAGKLSPFFLTANKESPTAPCKIPISSNSAGVNSFNHEVYAAAVVSSLRIDFTRAAEFSPRSPRRVATDELATDELATDDLATDDLATDDFEYSRRIAGEGSSN